MADVAVAVGGVDAAGAAQTSDYTTPTLAFNSDQSKGAYGGSSIGDGDATGLPLNALRPLSGTETGVRTSASRCISDTNEAGVC